MGGAAGLSGCTSSIPGIGGGPKYDSDAVSEMIPPASAFDIDLTRDDSVNENFEAAFASPDDSIFVLIGIDVSEGVSEAKTQFQTSREGFRDPQEMSVGNEAFWDTQN